MGKGAAATDLKWRMVLTCVLLLPAQLWAVPRDQGGKLFARGDDLRQVRGAFLPPGLPKVGSEANLARDGIVVISNVTQSSHLLSFPPLSNAPVCPCVRVSVCPCVRVSVCVFARRNG